MNTLDYQSPDLLPGTPWLKRYLWGVPIIALFYAAPVTAYWKYGLPLCRSHPDLAFIRFYPLALVPERYLEAVGHPLEPFLTMTGFVVVLLLANGAFWGFCVTAIWHGAWSLRRAIKKQH